MDKPTITEALEKLLRQSENIGHMRARGVHKRNPDGYARCLLEYIRAREQLERMIAAAQTNKNRPSKSI